MAVYDLRCAQGHDFEVIQPFGQALPPCPSCGSAATKRPSRFGVGGRASTPPPPERMPQTWRGTFHGDRGYVSELRRTVERREKLEERHPELAGDRRPVVAHEGHYEQAPLRRDDPPPAAGRPAHPAPGR